MFPLRGFHICQWLTSTVRTTMQQHLHVPWSWLYLQSTTPTMVVVRPALTNPLLCMVGLNFPDCVWLTLGLMSYCFHGFYVVISSCVLVCQGCVYSHMRVPSDYHLVLFTVYIRFVSLIFNTSDANYTKQWSLIQQRTIQHSTCQCQICYYYGMHGTVCLSSS